ncbi:hypothetical protein DAI22_03g406200 [Oryza sativa Japonica Group]|nr:hypothetical protein DAI22_03g406200 [Oryza sativa Japonica Group]
MATTHGEEAAGKAYKLAEDRFLVKDIAGALRAAREARRLFRSLPGLANAITAYEVHAPAATTRAGGRNWYAVLAVGDRSAKTSSGGGGVTHESLKRQYHRLCLVVHPDKNRSAAAAGAFRLLQKAWDELSLRHPPRAAGAAAAPGQARPSGTRTVQCPHCGCSFVALFGDLLLSGVQCVHCKQQATTPLWRRPATAGRAPPPPPPPPPPPQSSPPPPRQTERDAPPPPPQPSPPPPHQRERDTPPASPPQPAAPRTGSSERWKFSWLDKCVMCGARFTAWTWHSKCDECRAYRWTPGRTAGGGALLARPAAHHGRGVRTATEEVRWPVVEPWRSLGSSGAGEDFVPAPDGSRGGWGR